MIDENHIRIQNIKNRKLNSTLTFEKATSTNIRQLIRQLNPRKPMGIDTIPPKIIEMLNDNLCDNIESIRWMKGYKYDSMLIF